MKKALISAVAAFAMAAPFAPPASAAPGDQVQLAQYQGQNGDQTHNGDRGRGDDRARGDNQDHRNDQANDNNGNQWGRDRHGRRHAWRDTRHDARWDDSRHNGYYAYNQWHYGPPPRMNRNISLGYRPWARGQRLGYYGNRYQEVDYRSYNLRSPRHGYHWVRDNDGDFLLAAIATGVILQVVLNSGR